MLRLDILKRINIGGGVGYEALRLKMRTKQVFLIHKVDRARGTSSGPRYWIKEFDSEEDMLIQFPCSDADDWINTGRDLGYGLTARDHNDAQRRYVESYQADRTQVD